MDRDVAFAMHDRPELLLIQIKAVEAAQEAMLAAECKMAIEAAR
jgi:hypothetical protein